MAPSSYSSLFHLSMLSSLHLVFVLFRSCLRFILLTIVSFWFAPCKLYRHFRRSDPFFSFVSLHCLLEIVRFRFSKVLFVWLKKSEKCFLHGVLKGKNLYKDWDWKSMVTFQFFFLCMHLLFCYMKANNILLFVKKPAGLWEVECRRWKIKI